VEFERRRHSHSAIEITPLVDVVFNLLLFFMLASSLVQEPAVRIRLPESRTAEVKSDTALMLVISRDEKIYFQDRQIDLERLVPVLKGLQQQMTDRPLRLKSDREVNVGFLIKVIDSVRLAGISNFSILTERR
jgi:biopolymer transport protein ExbD